MLAKALRVLMPGYTGESLTAQNLTADEIAFVQVKSSATQAVLDEYVRRFNARRDRYAKMIFAVHSTDGPLIAPADSHVQLWTCEKLGELVVRRGLGEFVESKSE